MTSVQPELLEITCPSPDSVCLPVIMMKVEIMQVVIASGLVTPCNVWTVQTRWTIPEGGTQSGK